MKKEDLENFRKLLEEQRESLKKQLGAFATEDPNLKHNWETKYPNREDGDKEEEADEVQEYENSLSLEHSLETKLRDVNIALENIDKGKYGICENCGKEIEIERLKAAPEARLCMGCKNSK